MPCGLPVGQVDRAFDGLDTKDLAQVIVVFVLFLFNPEVFKHGSCLLARLWWKYEALGIWSGGAFLINGGQRKRSSCYDLADVGLVTSQRAGWRVDALSSEALIQQTYPLRVVGY